MHPSPLLAAVAAALVLSAGPAAAADLVPIEWNAAGGFERTLAVRPGGFAEVCGALPARAKVAWQFEADAPTDFNVHYHEGKKVVTPAKLRGAARGDGLLDVAASQDYCWMWTHKGTRQATITLKLQRR